MAEEKPITPFTLTLIAGVFVLLAGMFVVMLALSSPWYSPFWFVSFPEWGMAAGIIGIIMGAVILGGATLAYHDPKYKVYVGLIVVILSAISFVFVYGGFVVGTILGIMGGIMYMVWTPEEKKTCPRCGRQSQSDAVLCPYCGFWTFTPDYYYQAYGSQQQVQQQQQYPQQYQQQYQPPPQQTAQPPIAPGQMCTKCGSPIPPGGTFCPKCGTPVG